MTEVSWWQARTLAGEAMGGSSGEVVPLADALGRTLANDAAALTDLPGFPTAAMDGWVVRGPSPWTIVGTIDTGASSVVQLDAGEAMRIGTGGAVPAGATAVIPFEAATVTDSRVNADVTDRTHIRVQGEECVVGDVLALLKHHALDLLVQELVALACAWRQPHGSATGGPPGKSRDSGQPRAGRAHPRCRERSTV